MAQTSVLKAEARERVGKGAARSVRREDKVPAVIYGDKQPAMPISLNQRELTAKLHAGGFLTHLLQIEVNGETIRCIPKDYQLDPVKDFLIHVDFLRVGAGAKLTLAVPVHFLNHLDSPGLKRGGVLNVVRHAVDMVVPADAIPEFLTVDLTGLEIGDSVHISSIALPDGVRPTVTDRDFTVATIAGAVAETETPGAAAAAATPEGDAKKDDAKAPAKAPAKAAPKADDKGKKG